MWCRNISLKLMDVKMFDMLKTLNIKVVKVFGFTVFAFQVPLHCLLFWRDVQDYKAMFVGPSFSPNAVQLKAKVPIHTCIIILYTTNSGYNNYITQTAWLARCTIITMTYHPVTLC